MSQMGLFYVPGIPPNWDKEKSFGNHVVHVWTLLSLVRGKSVLLSYEEMHRNQYNLVAHGYGKQVYWFLRSMLDSMSLCMYKHDYYGAVELIYKVSLHLDNRWCLHHRLPGLIECATVAYDRPVARRWRRVLFMGRWKCRLAKWRAAFTEVWLRPGGEGERQLAKRFRINAHLLARRVQ